MLRLNASVSEDEQFSLKEYVDLNKVQMRDDLIKNLADPLNKRIDDLTAQHHGLSQRVAQWESRQQVIVDEARRGQDRGETLRTQVTEIKRAVSCALTRLRAATIMEFETIARLETQAIDVYNDARQYRGEDSLTHDPEIPQVQYFDKTVDVPVVTQGQVLASQTVQKTEEVPQVQFLDRVLDVHVVPQRRVPIQERTVEETIDIPVPHVMEKTLEVVRHISQEKVHSYTLEQTVDVPVPQIRKETGHVIQLIPHERTSHHVIEQTVAVPIPQIPEETQQVNQLTPQGRTSDRVVEQIIDTPVRQIREQAGGSQIEVTVPTHTNFTGRFNQITIANKKGRPSPTEMIMWFRRQRTTETRTKLTRRRSRVRMVRRSTAFQCEAHPS